MRDPYKITEPTCISFSGGRTSGYMLWRVLRSNGGLPADATVCFANTGKEEEATLRFVRDCAERWGVPITWLEFRDDDAGFAVVDFETASRDGEPFEALIRKRNYLPNPVARFCTVEMKILTIERHLKASGWDDWVSMVGVRADEPRRVAKMRADPKGGRASATRALPLADDDIDAAQVGAFWRAQPFDLELPNMNGTTVHGNCDLCFLKGAGQVLSLIAEKPSRATWWARMESSITNAKIQNGGRFRSDRPSYEQMVTFATAQADAFGYEDEGIACFCGD
jgi:3'-phosphoadenosine 5'-phosphosulfate sulfotransferase (PAPS reductase)/FAD synthetase